MTVSIPAARAIAPAVRALSPVSITTSSPSRRSSATASLEPDFRGSAIPRTAAGLPSIATNTGVRPFAASSSAAATSDDASTPTASRNAARPTTTVEPSTTARTPSPGVASKPSATGGSIASVSRA
jgi:hypothetical protein